MALEHVLRCCRCLKGILELEIFVKKQFHTFLTDIEVMLKIYVRNGLGIVCGGDPRSCLECVDNYLTRAMAQ